MEQVPTNELTLRLQQRMEELLMEIVEIKEYLGEPQIVENESVLPLGVMGDVMSSELMLESAEIAEQAHYIVCEKDVDSWEKVKSSVYLHRKILMLMTLARIIAQLPAHTAQARHMITEWTAHVIEQCRVIDDVISVLMAEIVRVPAPVKALA